MARTNRPHFVGARLTSNEYDVVRAMPGETDADRLRALIQERAELARTREAIRAELEPIQQTIRDEIGTTRETVERLDATIEDRVWSKLELLWKNMCGRWERSKDKKPGEGNKR